MSKLEKWQKAETSGLIFAIRRLQTELPGWWWRIGNCHVSADATIGPDSAGPDAGLLGDLTFDAGFDGDLRHPATPAEALDRAIDLALETKRARSK